MKGGFYTLLIILAVVAPASVPEGVHQAWQRLLGVHPSGLKVRLVWSMTEVDSPIQNMKSMAPMLEAQAEKRMRDRGLPEANIQLVLTGLRRAHLADQQIRSSEAELVCETDGSLYRQIKSGGLHRVANGQATPSAGRTAEGWRPGYETKDFFSPATAGQVARESANPFSLTGGNAINPIMLGLLPVASRFAEADVTGVSPDTVQLTKPFPGDRSYQEVLTFDRRKQVPVRYELVNLKSKRALFQYETQSVTSCDGVIFPEIVDYRSLRSDGTPAVEVRYVLKAAAVGGKAAVEDVGQPVQAGEMVVDSRFGPGKERYYRSNGTFLSDDEVLGKKLEPKRQVVSRSNARTPIYGLSAILISIGFALLGIRAMRSRRSSDRK